MKIIIILLITSAISFSQTKDDAHNVIYFELGGNGLFTSLNYERSITNNFSARIGVGYAFNNSSSNSGAHHDYAFLPVVMLNYMFEIYGNNFIEAGGGALISSSALSSVSSFETTVAVVPTIAVGYRYSPKDGGFFFSIAFDSFFGYGSFQPWGGIGIGYNF